MTFTSRKRVSCKHGINNLQNLILNIRAICMTGKGWGRRKISILRRQGKIAWQALVIQKYSVSSGHAAFKLGEFTFFYHEVSQNWKHVYSVQVPIHYPSVAVFFLTSLFPFRTFKKYVGRTSSFSSYWNQRCMDSLYKFSPQGSGFGNTVKPVLSGHLWGLAKCPFNTGCLLNTGPLKMNFGCGQIHILFNYITGNNNK